MRIMAKIENAEGVANLEEIIKVCDSVMVARATWAWRSPLRTSP